MPKWRWMYRARPEIRGGIDKKVILSVGKGSKVVCEDDREIEGYVAKLMDILNIREVYQSAVTDMLVYGQALFEKVRTTPDEKQEGEEIALSPEESRSYAAMSRVLSRRWVGNEFDSEGIPRSTVDSYTHDVQAIDEFMAKNDLETTVFIPKSQRYQKWLGSINPKKLYNYARHIAQTVLPQTPSTEKALTLQRRRGVNPQSDKLRDEVYAIPEGELIELKPVDPLFMRINRDAFNNIIGFVQWGPSPIPQSVPMDKLVFLRWMPKSWLQESAYGTSVLMPVQRHVSMLVQAEEDMKVFWHQYAKPTWHVAVGTEDKPYPMPAIQAYVNQVKNRVANTDIVTPGDVKVNVLQAGTRQTAQTFDVWVKYLREKIYETLAIPDVLMNLPGEMTRATSDVTLQAFVAEEKMIQEMVGEQILKQVIEPEVRRHFVEKYPDGQLPVMKMVWPDVLEEDRNKRADRLAKAIGVPYETVNEGRAEAGLEAIPDPQYDQIQAAPMAGAGMGMGENPFNPPPSRTPETNESQRTGDREETLQKRDAGNASAMVVVPSQSDLEKLRTKRPDWQA